MKSATIFSAILGLFVSLSAVAQVRHFEGNWTKINTTYDFSFQLMLEHSPNNSVQGTFIWTVEHYDENSTWSTNYYGEKLGKMGKEFVTGTFNPQTGSYRFHGVDKEDPHLVIGLDVYKLKLDRNGNIGGDTNANGSWLGRINGKEVSDLAL